VPQKCPEFLSFSTLLSTKLKQNAAADKWRNWLIPEAA
jgi:hypothetical protein